jgi:uncharacterized repeat protein (TIGR03803 family)
MSCMATFAYTHAARWGLVLSTLFLVTNAAAGNERVLYNFCTQPDCADGGDPEAELSVDNSGNLYGTTFSGGLNGGGVVFKLAPDGAETVLHAFQGGVDGSSSLAGVVADKAGNLYGTTWDSGANLCGTIFRIAPDGSESVLYSFKGGNDGCSSSGTLLLDDKGDLFGTTQGGGRGGLGTVFELKPSGKERVLHSFGGGSDGSVPNSGLIRDKQGDLFGVTLSGGGTGCNGQGCGTVFALTAKGGETVIYAFKGGDDGAEPRGTLLLDKAGNLYGTTSFGAKTSGGTVFKIAPNGTETLLYIFCSLSGCVDGAGPVGGVISDGVGNLYGTASDGGANCAPDGCGAVFKLSPNGTETVLYSFAGGNDGEFPDAGLTKGANGTLYGTTIYGGTGAGGVAFKLKK